MVKDKVLQELEKNKGIAVSGEALAQSLGVSRTAVWKAVNALRAEGFDIKKAQSVGYILSKDSDRIFSEGIQSYLKHKVSLQINDVVDSTNSRAVALAADNAQYPVAVIAEEQTAGRGRMGRRFYSPKDKGIYLSLIIKPAMGTEGSLLVTSAAAVATAKAIREICELEAGIKWVNDIYLDGKKICGILTEGIADFETGQISRLIVGIGINCSSSDFKSKGLEKKAGALNVKGLERNKLIAAIIDKLLDIVESLEKGDSSFIADYKSLSLVLGKQVTVYPTPVTDMANKYDATAVDIDNHGGLVVRLSDGSYTTLSTGEITVRLK